MMKYSRILRLVFVIACHLAKDILGFQPPSGTVIFQQQPQQANLPFIPNRWNAPERPSSSSSNVVPLSAFNGGGGLGGRNNNNGSRQPGYFVTAAAAETPLTTTKDVVRRLTQLVTRTLGQFSSGWMTGYLAGSLWSLVRGPSSRSLVTGVSRGMVWGMDFGIVSAIFSGTDLGTKFVLDLFTFLSSGDRAKQQQQEQQQPQTSTTVKQQQQQQQQQQTAWLWSVVLRNVLLAVYFGRHGGAIKMARSSVFYGALTYYFVSQKQKRDTDAMAAMLYSNRTVGRGNYPSPVSSSSSSSSSAALLQELMSRQFANRSSGTMSTPSPTGSTSSTTTNTPFVGRSASSGYQSTTTTATNKRNTNSSSPPDNVLDVEFEKVDDNDKANPN